MSANASWGGVARLHQIMKDSALQFKTSNGCTSTSLIEWEFVYTAKLNSHEYPIRENLDPALQRKPIPIAVFMEEGGLLETEANSKLREGGHSLLILEEILAGRLYTGPM